ncbi:serine kinase [Sedimentitalea sp. CY04]|uniref:Serine kinase n=1 Tax=Parasedimentitalea denitrificans TaxID=2211118 RepID=A0ABX0WC88_9RHOB|nr:HPr kinase/phosphatase C-terminal domain-containing protein [Sedimentitalea sp. CY04]NIZ62473.1 serine kinase [Sedimentitalea sp. CY04]
MGGTGDLCLHASCVSLDGNGLLIRGGSGSGKSTLALSLMALGAKLVADDRVLLTLEQGDLIARAPDSIAGLIEARGLGILSADRCFQTVVDTVIDMDTPETDRLPPIRTVMLLGQSVTLLHRPSTAHLAPALLQYLKRGRQDPDSDGAT